MKAIVVTDRSAGTAGMRLEERPDPDVGALESGESGASGSLSPSACASKTNTQPHVDPGRSRSTLQ